MSAYTSVGTRWQDRGPTRIVLSIVFAIWGGGAIACAPSYVIQPGDTLSQIARDQLGSIFDYPRIHDDNRDVIGDDPNLIFAGDRLSIPCEFVELQDIDWSVMPNPTAVAVLMKQTPIQVLDIRSEKAIADGVVPGAVSAPYGLWRGPADNPGSPPPDAILERVISEAGLDLAEPIVIVHGKDNAMDTGRAARVYWMLKSSGADELAILRGGFGGWLAANLPVALEPARPDPVPVKISFSDEWRAGPLDIHGISTGQIGGHLLDARPHGMFAKLDDMGRALATTLPGAKSAPAQPLMAALSGEIDVASGTQRVIDYLVEHEADWTEGPVVSFCHTGELGALNWFYASELAGLPRMRLYPDSIKGWQAVGGELVPGAAEDSEG